MRPTFSQIGRLLALQAEANVMSDIPETAREAAVYIETLERIITGAQDKKNATNLNSTDKDGFSERKTDVLETKV